VRELAVHAGLEEDDALLMLWDVGINVASPSEVLRGRVLATARTALGIPKARELRSLSYLARLANLTEAEAKTCLSSAGLRLIEGDRIPRGSFSHARKILGIAAFTLAGLATDEKLILEPPDLTAFELPLIGRIQDMLYLGAADVENIHWILVEEFSEHNDPISPPGVRDHSLLEGAVFRPQTSLGDDLKYPTVPMSAAALLHSLVLDHAFYNGNKRTGLVSSLVFLEKNHCLLESDEFELFQFVLKVAKHDLCDHFDGPFGADREVATISEWFFEHTRPVQTGDRRLQFRDLRRILNHYQCHIQLLPGSRVLITRIISREGWFLRRGRRLQSHNFYAGEGRDVEVNTLQRIRRDLWLDEQHGVDSLAFYGSEPGITEFIAKYRMTLQRLAKW
jgi:death-on-curing family protein